jgi:hypothetical protein
MAANVIWKFAASSAIADVAGAGEDRSDADAITLDRGNNRNWDIQQGEPTVIEAKHESVARFGGHARVPQLSQHVAGASDGEILASSPDDRGVQLVAVFEPVDRGGESMPISELMALPRFASSSVMTATAPSSRNSRCAAGCGPYCFEIPELAMCPPEKNAR